MRAARALSGGSPRPGQSPRQGERRAVDGHGGADGVAQDWAEEVGSDTQDVTPTSATTPEREDEAPADPSSEEASSPGSEAGSSQRGSSPGSERVATVWRRVESTSPRQTPQDAPTQDAPPPTVGLDQEEARGNLEEAPADGEAAVVLEQDQAIPRRFLGGRAPPIGRAPSMRAVISSASFSRRNSTEASQEESEQPLDSLQSVRRKVAGRRSSLSIDQRSIEVLQIYTSANAGPSEGRSSSIFSLPHVHMEEDEAMTPSGASSCSDDQGEQFRQTKAHLREGTNTMRMSTLRDNTDAAKSQLGGNNLGARRRHSIMVLAPSFAATRQEEAGAAAQEQVHASVDSHEKAEAGPPAHETETETKPDSTEIVSPEQSGGMSIAHRRMSLVVGGQGAQMPFWSGAGGTPTASIEAPEEEEGKPGASACLRFFNIWWRAAFAPFVWDATETRVGWGTRGVAGEVGRRRRHRVEARRKANRVPVDDNPCIAALAHPRVHSPLRGATFSEEALLADNLRGGAPPLERTSHGWLRPSMRKTTGWLDRSALQPYDRARNVEQPSHDERSLSQTVTPQTTARASSQASGQTGQTMTGEMRRAPRVPEVHRGLFLRATANREKMLEQLQKEEMHSQGARLCYSAPGFRPGKSGTGLRGSAESGSSLDGSRGRGGWPRVPTARYERASQAMETAGVKGALASLEGETSSTWTYSQSFQSGTGSVEQSRGSSEYGYESEDENDTRSVTAEEWSEVEERLKAWDGRMGVAWERYTAAASGELPPSPRAPSPSLVTNLRSPGVHLSTMQPSPKAANGSVSFSSKVLPTAFRGKGPAHTRLGSTVGAGRHAVVSSPLGGRGGEGGAHNVGGVSSGSKFVKKGARKKIVGEHDQLAAQREALQEVQRVVAEAEEVKEDRARLERRRVRAAARKEIEEGRADAATLIAFWVRKVWRIRRDNARAEKSGRGFGAVMSMEGLLHELDVLRENAAKEALLRLPSTVEEAPPPPDFSRRRSSEECREDEAEEQRKIEERTRSRRTKSRFTKGGVENRSMSIGIVAEKESFEHVFWRLAQGIVTERDHAVRADVFFRTADRKMVESIRAWSFGEQSQAHTALNMARYSMKRAEAIGRLVRSKTAADTIAAAHARRAEKVLHLEECLGKREDKKRDPFSRTSSAESLQEESDTSEDDHSSEEKWGSSFSSAEAGLAQVQRKINRSPAVPVPGSPARVVPGQHLSHPSRELPTALPQAPGAKLAHSLSIYGGKAPHPLCLSGGSSFSFAPSPGGRGGGRGLTIELPEDARVVAGEAARRLAAALPGEATLKRKLLATPGRMQPGLLLAHQMEAVQREQNLRLFKQTVVLK